MAEEPASGIFVWPSRDPIGESGGLNLYGFGANDPVNRWDALGMLTNTFELEGQAQASIPGGGGGGMPPNIVTQFLGIHGLQPGAVSFVYEVDWECTRTTSAERPHVLYDLIGIASWEKHLFPQALGSTSNPLFSLSGGFYLDSRASSFRELEAGIGSVLQFVVVIEHGFEFGLSVGSLRHGRSGQRFRAPRQHVDKIPLWRQYYEVTIECCATDRYQIPRTDATAKLFKVATKPAQSRLQLDEDGNLPWHDSVYDSEWHIINY